MGYLFSELWAIGQCWWDCSILCVLVFPQGWRPTSLNRVNWIRTFQQLASVKLCWSVPRGSACETPDLNGATAALCLQAKFQTCNNERDKVHLESMLLQQWKGFKVYVGWYKCASMYSIGVWRCALGLYHHSDNEITQVKWNLSVDNFPAKTSIPFQSQLMEP